MAPVSYQGQAYLTSQYFHRLYLNNSPVGGKYQRHDHFLRVLRTAPLYEDYLRLGNIVELTWNDVKATKDVLPPNREQWQTLFQATGFHPLVLLNATAQSELAHHLDDEASKQIAHAANKASARQHQNELSSTAQGTQLVQEVTARLRAEKALRLEAGYSEPYALIEATKATIRETGYTALEDIVNQSPQLRDVPEEDLYLLVSKLEPILQIPREGSHAGHALNLILKKAGMQYRDAADIWRPTAKARQAKACVISPQIKRSWSGPVLMWKQDIAERCRDWVWRQEGRKRRRISWRRLSCV